ISSFALHNLKGFPPTEAHSLNIDTHGGTPFAVVQINGTTGQSQKRYLQDTPWQRWVPESTDTSLHLEQRCLLGIGLMVQRAHTVVRTTTFANAVGQWYQAAKFPATSNPLPVGGPLAGSL